MPRRVPLSALIMLHRWQLPCCGLIADFGFLPLPLLPLPLLLVFFLFFFSPPLLFLSQVVILATPSAAVDDGLCDWDMDVVDEVFLDFVYNAALTFLARFSQPPLRFRAVPYGFGLPHVDRCL